MQIRGTHPELRRLPVGPARHTFTAFVTLFGIVRAGARRLLAAWHGGCGRLAFRLGRPVGARRHFERVLDLDGDVFSAYVHLGLLAWQIGDYSGYRRELEHARRIDPERYRRLRHPFEPFAPRGGRTASDEADERATWRSVRQGQGTTRRGTVHRVELPTENLDGLEPALCEPFTDLDGAQQKRRTGDDFSSPAERDRFAVKRPISRSEVASTDLDDLCRQLSA